MIRRLLRGPAGSHGARPRRPRARLTGCLLWLLVLVILLIILSLLFGGFHKGAKADTGPAHRPPSAAAAPPRQIGSPYT